MLLHSECAGCGTPGDALCRRCRFQLAAAPRPESGEVIAALPYLDLSRALVHALKYRNGRRLAPHLAEALARRLRSVGVVPGSIDVVTWAPTSATRRSRRGYDHAELVARALGRVLGVPARRVLHRVHGPAQTGQGRARRLVGPSFRARPDVRGRRILVVDDVVTTGATLRAARAALEAAEVAEVLLAAVTAVGETQRPRAPRLHLVTGGAGPAQSRWHSGPPPGRRAS